MDLVVEQTSADRFTIAGEIEIVLLQVRHDRAHIGVISPEGVTIARGEVYRARSRDG